MTRSRFDSDSMNLSSQLYVRAKDGLGRVIWIFSTLFSILNNSPLKASDQPTKCRESHRS